jgi:hypothetical protein
VLVSLDAPIVGQVWRQVADQEGFMAEVHESFSRPVEAELFMPALGCGLWCTC